MVINGVLIETVVFRNWGNAMLEKTGLGLVSMNFSTAHIIWRSIVKHECWQT